MELTNIICRMQDFHLWYNSARIWIYMGILSLATIPCVIALLSQEKIKKKSDLTYADFERSIALTVPREKRFCGQR